LTYIADVTVNGHPETKGRPLPPADAAPPIVPWPGIPIPEGGTKRKLDELGPEASPNGCGPKSRSI
jgi:pyruvate carboxylase